MQISNLKVLSGLNVAALALFVSVAVSGCQSPQVATVAATPTPAEIEVAPAPLPTQTPAPIIQAAPTIPVATPTTAPRRGAVTARVPIARATPEPSLSETFPVQPPRDLPTRRTRRSNGESRPAAPSLNAPERADQTPISGGQVWVNTNSDVYHMPGMRYYGKTREGYYATESEAQAAGYRRATR